MKVKNGYFGVVNGMYLNGKVDEICMQFCEVWMGVMYVLVVVMIYEGMFD